MSLKAPHSEVISEPVLIQLGSVKIYPDRVESACGNYDNQRFEIIPFSKVSHISYFKASSPGLKTAGFIFSCLSVLFFLFTITLAFSEDDAASGFAVPAFLLSVTAIAFFIAYGNSKKTFLRFVSTGSTNITIFLNDTIPQAQQDQLLAVARERLRRYNP